MALEVPYRSIPDMLLHRAAASPDTRAFGYPTDDGAGWLTWAELAARAKAVAAGLIGLGVTPEDRVAILANTRVEWIIANLGILCAGAATTTIYPTTDRDDAAYILRDSGATVLIAEDAGQVAKADGVDGLAVVQIDGTPATGAISLAALEDSGRTGLAAEPELVDRVVAGIGPEHLATVMYTSGTTGRPKGVELLHEGWCFEGVAAANMGVLEQNDLQYLWLPLSHSFGMVLMSGAVAIGLPTYVDGRVDKLVENLAAIRPTLMASPPRVYEKVYNRVITSAKEAGGAKWKIFTWAMGVGHEVSKLTRAGGKPSGVLALKHAVADKLVFSKIRERLGGRIRILVSGAAPLGQEIAEFFHAAGLTILEGYGLTETSAGAFVNRPDAYRLGSVGLPFPGIEVKLDTDGEVLIKGPMVMRGYHRLPDQTRAAFTDDGYLRTGDIGKFDDDGFLRITDRKKDLIKTSGGKYVAPSYIEGVFKAICPYVSQVLVIGQARNFCTMILTLDPDAVAAWAPDRKYSDVVAAAETRELISPYVKQLNERLNRWETIKKFTVLPRDLSIEDGELTPSLKIKRRAVEQHFADRIEEMYEGSLAG